MMSSFTALEIYEPEADVLYSIEAASHLTQVPRRRIALYCQHGLVSPVMDPDSGGWYFNDEGVRRLRQIEQLRATCGVNLTGLKMVLGLTAEVERLREELRILRRG